MDLTIADFAFEDTWESELSSLFPQNNEVFLLLNSDPSFSFDSSGVSSSSNSANVEYFENQSIFSPIPIQQQQQTDSIVNNSNLDDHHDLNENVSDLMNRQLVETMTPLFEEQLQSSLASLMEQPFANFMFLAQPSQLEETQKKRKEISSSNESSASFQKSKKRKKDNAFSMNQSITVSSTGVSSSSSSSNSNTPTTPTTNSNSKKKSNSKRKGWLENICNSIDKPAEELVLPPVVGNGGKRTLRFHTVNFK